jgi:hypothetical protein
LFLVEIHDVPAELVSLNLNLSTQFLEDFIFTPDWLA